MKTQRIVILALTALSPIVAEAATDGFDYPIGNKVKYTRESDGDGWRVDQRFAEWNADYQKYHLGEDWNAESGGNSDCGTNVYAVASGTIVFAQVATGWGKVMIIRHTLPNGVQVESLYGHMATFAKTSGDVARGEPIGTVGDGSEGGATYLCHLHLEIRTPACPSWGTAGPGYWETASPPGWVNPSDFIDANRPGGLPLGITQVNLNGALVSADAGGIVRVRGARILSDSTGLDDYVVLQYRLQIPSLALQPVSATVYPDIGVVYRPEAIFTKDVPAEFTFTRGGPTGNSSTSYTLTTTNDQAFRMTLEAGTTLCFSLSNPSRNYHFIIQKADTGEIIRDSYLLAGSNWAAWQTAVFAAGEYLFFFQAEGTNIMTLTMTAFNSNRFPLSDLINGSSFSASFRQSSGDYRKWRVFLQRGQTLTVTKTSGSGDVYRWLLFEDSTSVQSGGFETFAHIVEQTGQYYLVCRMTGTESGSCAGTISISGPAMSYASWRNFYEFSPGMEYGDRDPDGDGLPNFAEYALDMPPLTPTSSREFQSLSLEGGNAALSITTPKYAIGASYQVLSGDDIRNLNNRSIQIVPNPSDPAKQDLKVIDPLGARQFYQLRITNSQP